MADLKAEGHSIYILKTPWYQDRPEHQHILFTGIGPSQAVPLEQLTKVTRKNKHIRIKLKMTGTVPRGWNSDYTLPYLMLSSS